MRCDPMIPPWCLRLGPRRPTLGVAGLLRPSSKATYSSDLNSPLGSCPWPGSWSRTHGAHLLLTGRGNETVLHGSRGAATLPSAKRDQGEVARRNLRRDGGGCSARRTGLEPPQSASLTAPPMGSIWKARDLQDRHSRPDARAA